MSPLVYDEGMNMSERQWRVLRLIERLNRGEVTVAQVATSIGRSQRQVQRIRKRVAKLGTAAVIHGNRGRSPEHRISDETRARVLELHEQKYAGFNDHHLTEKLVEVEQISISRETVRRILRAAGRRSPRTRRPRQYRKRRERRAQAGMMILWDGSDHDWLEGRGPRLCLMAAVDDATGELLPGTHFARKEGTLPYLRLLRDIVRSKGIPHVAYGDRHSSLRRNDSNWTLEEELAGAREPTQVRLALERLGIQPRYAQSPQAKGRIERVFNTLQDRLVSELRLAGASTISEANRVLTLYRPLYNARFARPAQDAQTAWNPAPKDSLATADLCALQYARKVRKNNSIQIDGQVIDISESAIQAHGSFAGRTVIVRHLLNGRFHVYYEGERITWFEGRRPKRPAGAPRTLLGARKRRRQLDERKKRLDDENDSWG